MSAASRERDRQRRIAQWVASRAAQAALCARYHGPYQPIPPWPPRALMEGETLTVPGRAVSPEEPTIALEDIPLLSPEPPLSIPPPS